MAANPKRKGISTLPVYLPSMQKGARAAPRAEGDESSGPRIYVEGAFDPSAAESLAETLAQSEGLDATIEGEIISALPRQAQLLLRHAIATAARGLASARVSPGQGGGQPHMPLRGEVDQEEDSLHARTHREYEDHLVPPLPTGLLYNGEAVQATFRELLPEAEGAANIIVTSRALAAWNEDAGEWSPQAVVPGDPMIVGRIAGDETPDAESLGPQVLEALAR